MGSVESLLGQQRLLFHGKDMNQTAGDRVRGVILRIYPWGFRRVFFTFMPLQSEGEEDPFWGALGVPFNEAGRCL